MASFEDRIKELAREISRTLACNCDLDTWEPEPYTGHSHVCRIHKAAVEAARNSQMKATCKLRGDEK